MPSVHIVGAVQGESFSNLPKVYAYEPLVKLKSRSLHCSFTKLMLPQHRSYVESSPLDEGDLSVYVPEVHQADVLSVVKFYGDLPDEHGLKALSPAERGAGNNMKLNSTKAPEPVIITNSQGILERVTAPNEVPASLLARFAPKVRPT